MFAVIFRLLQMGGNNVIVFIVKHKCIPEVEVLESNKFLIVEAKALPQVFSRVVEAKRLLECGKAKNLSHAAKLAGVSRGALYKYRNSVFPYESNARGKITNFHIILKDRPGVLSSLISEIYRGGANILTINQNIPVDTVASISMSVSLDSTGLSDMQMLAGIKKLPGVVEARCISPK
jgi:chorismate mutase